MNRQTMMIHDPVKNTLQIIDRANNKNVTLKASDVLELCEEEGLNITSFITVPTGTGHTIKLEVDVDDRKCGTKGE